MARGRSKAMEAAEEQLRRVEEQLKGEQPATPQKESPEDILRRAEETLERGDMPPEKTETDEEVRARVRREMLGRTAERGEVPKLAPTEEKPGKLRPEQKAGLESKIRQYEEMIAKEEEEFERVAETLGTTKEAAMSKAGKHLQQMRETLRRMKDELRRAEEKEPGLTP